MAKTGAERTRKYRRKHPKRVRKALRAWFKRHPSYNREWQKKRYDKEYAVKTAWLREQKNKPCADCGGSFPFPSMDFDHVKGKKVREVGSMWQLSRFRILAEIKKCDVVCSNCHRIRTYNRRHPESPLEYTKVTLPGRDKEDE